MNPEELDRLVHRYFEQDLSPEEETLLWMLVRTDPAVADRFVELSELESGLVESLKAEEAAPPEVSTPMRNSRRRTQVLRTPAQRAVWPLFAAAALMLGFVAILMQSVEKPAAPPLAQRPAPAVEKPVPAPPVAPSPERVAPRPLPEPRPVQEPLPPPLEPKPVIAKTPVDEPKTEPKPEVKPDPAPVDKPVVPTEVVAEAQIRDVEGEVVRISETAGPLGPSLRSGQGLEVRKGSAALVLADGTRVELRPNTRLDKMTLAGDLKKFELSRGAAASTVTKQPAKGSVLFLTPQSEMTVIGTKLSFEIAGEATRLDVQEGRVKLMRLSDKASVEVTAGHFAVAGKGPAPVSRPAPVVRAFQDGLFPTPDYAGTRDCWLSSLEPTQNFATGNLLRLQKLSASNTTLIQWNVASIPPGSRVLSAELSFWVTGKLDGNCKIFDLRQPFNENEATWRLAASGRSWRIQGAEADHGPKPVGLLAPATTGMYTMSLNELGVGLVQDWVNDQKLNYGILILGPDANEWNLDSRESVRPERRPKLTVTYIPAK